MRIATGTGKDGTVRVKVAFSCIVAILIQRCEIRLTLTYANSFVQQAAHQCTLIMTYTVLEAKIVPNMESQWFIVVV